MTVPARLLPRSALFPYPTLFRSVTVLVPPAAPLIVTSVPVKPLTGSLNTAVKLIGEARSEERRVGKGWSVTVGGVVSRGVKLTLLSVLVEAVLRLPAASLATPAAMVAITVAAVVMREVAAS